jgi:hypothetical protein
MGIEDKGIKGTRVEVTKSIIFGHRTWIKEVVTR